MCKVTSYEYCSNMSIQNGPGTAIQSESEDSEVDSLESLPGDAAAANAREKALGAKKQRA